ncbi:FKBP-type peptidyl-prolyl cis-trans isomerase [Streptomyces sp. NPDC059985]|uniref:FKBP-type peptidyl-prolyl cis-trans isomerase n=1 Tax=Streptomyces sp. NPDC059985 TaxID=3347025 RepID=UPI00368C461D
MRFAILLVLSVLLSVALAGCGDPDPVLGGKLPPLVSGTEFGREPKLSPVVGTPPKVLLTQVLRQGSGPKIRSGDTVEVNYIEQVWGEPSALESTFEDGSPLRFTAGSGEVISGWEQALVGVRVGTRLEMSVPPEFAYGSSGDGRVKPYSVLLYVIDVVRLQTPQKAPAG